MRFRTLAGIGLLLAGQFVAGGVAEAASRWQVVLPDTVQVQCGTVLLRDITLQPVPAAAGEIVLDAGSAPNTAIRISRQMILRKLVTAGLSAGVSFRGAESCCLAFAGHELNGNTLATAVRRKLQTLVPSTAAGAPVSWFEFDYPSLRLSADGDWQIQLNRHVPLEPGRNLVQVRLVSGNHHEVFGASVVLHSFGETARAVRAIDRETPLNEAQFRWQWQDLAEVASGIAVGRDALAGASTARSLAAGDPLRQADLHETPLILAGDPVELLVVRGQVAVTVRAFARQQGCLHQTIPVRNELTGRLVNARVAGPGLVEWRR